MSELDLRETRLEKLSRYIEFGIQPYPNKFKKPNDIAFVLALFENEENLGKTIITAGRVVAKRSMGKAAFFHIEDESDKIQVYANNKTLSEADFLVLKNLDLGDIVGIEGSLFYTKTKESTIQAQKVNLLAKNISPLPVVKEKDGKQYDVFSDIEIKYRRRYLDLAVSKKTREDFRKRSEIIALIRQILQEKGFIEVETPMMQNVASGALARPFETFHNALSMPLFLRIAPELYLKRLIVGGFEKVFELNRNFRNEGISTKHNPEFTMVEVYQAYADFQTMMDLTQEIFTLICDKVFGSRIIPYGNEIIEFKDEWEKKPYLKSIEEETGLDFTPFLNDPEPNLEEAQKMAKSVGISKEGRFWEIVDAIFSEKVEPKLIQPVMITEFPKAISPLAKSISQNKNLVERFEPYIIGREMGNAFTELNDPQEQYLRFQNQKKEKEAGAIETMEIDEDFIQALEVGMPPTGGLGLGIDRMIMLFLNKPSIKDVILFPTLRK